MPTTYQPCTPDVESMVQGLIKQYYPDLEAADVSLCLLFAVNGESPALMQNGYPALAMVRLNNLRDRIAGLKDATILIDQSNWVEWSDEERLAVLDHELYHLEVKRTKYGQIEHDDANRPKLKLRKHDFQIGGFHGVVRRHGATAFEAQAVARLVTSWRQNEFAWSDEAEMQPA